MRLISAVPRGLTEKSRSSTMMVGRRFVIVSSARSASPSEKAITSPLRPPARCCSAGSRSVAPMRTVQDSATADEYTVSRGFCGTIPPPMELPPYRDVTVGDLLTRLARALPDAAALVYAGGPRYTFTTLEREARLVARGLIASGVEPGER